MNILLRPESLIYTLKQDGGDPRPTGVEPLPQNTRIILLN